MRNLFTPIRKDKRKKPTRFAIYTNGRLKGPRETKTSAEMNTMSPASATASPVLSLTRATPPSARTPRQA